VIGDDGGSFPVSRPRENTQCTYTTTSRRRRFLPSLLSPSDSSYACSPKTYPKLPSPSDAHEIGLRGTANPREAHINLSSFLDVSTLTILIQRQMFEKSRIPPTFHFVQDTTSVAPLFLSLPLSITTFMTENHRRNLNLLTSLATTLLPYQQRSTTITKPTIRNPSPARRQSVTRPQKKTTSHSFPFALNSAVRQERMRKFDAHSPYAEE
jgi:hypothetical protein